MENNIVFTTTDGYPVSIGDRYHIVDEGEISLWVCDEDDEIPTCATYSKFENARTVKINGKYFKDDI